MEASGIVCRTVSSLPAARVGFSRRFSGESNLGVWDSRVPVRPRGKSCRRLSFQFSDSGHVQYYVSPRAGGCGGGVATKKDKGKSSEIRAVKKKLKLMKRLSKDLSMLPEIASSEDIRIGLAADFKVTMIQEASDVLLAHLQKLKSAQKGLKRKLKEERAQMKATLEKSESSSSSSESSDSECGEMVDMKALRSNALKPSVEIEPPTDNALKQPEKIETETPSVAEESTLTSSLLELENSDSSPKIRVRIPSDGGCCSSNGLKDGHSNSLLKGTSTKKIEVCMGGKCKKLGAPALLEEFEKKVGAEGTVVACKCMGKCRTAPNVRVSNTQSDTASRINEDSVRLGINPTCTGVGLQDVDLILANLLGKDMDDECLMLSS